MKPSHTRSLALIALMAALTAVCAWITVPAAVPFTMQTFAVVLSLELLGGKRGTAAVLVYLLLGAVGLPVFSGFTGGVGHFAAPTGGYLLGFLVSGAVYIAGEKRLKKKLPGHILLIALALAGCYLPGTLWFSLSTGTPFVPAFMICVLPFVLPDAAKAALAAVVAARVRRIAL